MKILFISSGNSVSGITPIVNNQGLSLKSIGHDVYFYAIKEKGIHGYLKAITPLKKLLKENHFDVLHAHYSLSGFLCVIAFPAKPIIVSLMGSDIKDNLIMRLLIKFFVHFFWDKTIVKSTDMKVSLAYKKATVIPNGVNMDKFYPIDKLKAKERLDWKPDKKHILFPADPSRDVKNYPLTHQAIEKFDRNDIQLHYLSDVPNEDMIFYYNAADVVLLTSKWEGSPNVIKEAMACNCPIVSTNVGDVEEVIGNTKGCYICSFEPEDVAEKLLAALQFGKRTNGRENIKHLDDKIIAQKLIDIYESVTLA